MKKIISILLAAGACITSVHAKSDINIEINGNDFVTETEPVIINDRVLVPMRAIFEKFGAEVDWNGEISEVTAIKDDLTVNLQIGSNMLYKNSEAVEIDVPAVIENERTLVPLRAVSVCFGAEVEWDSQTRTVYIEYENDKQKKVINIEIAMEDGGIMTAELYPEIAPITVQNFVKLANEGFYDGLIFHRVIEGFMIQGGGYDKNFQTKEAESIKGEFSANGIENDLKHTRGVLSMARTIYPDSASGQFFIMHQDAPHLDGMYAAFGKLTGGFDVLDRIASQETGALDDMMTDVPINFQVIKSIRVTDND